MAVAAPAAPVAVVGQAPPAKLNPPANAKSIWVERDTAPRSFRTASSTKLPVGEATVERTDSGAVLKWRAKRPTSYQQPVRNVAAFSNTDEGSVRQAAQLESLDPFDDPFNDSVAQNDDGGSFQLEPPETESGPRNQGPLKQPGGEPPIGPTPIPDPDEDKPEAPESFEVPRDLPRSEPLPAPSNSERYRGRDCDEDEKHCRLIRETVNANTIDKIQLNITPTIEPEAETEEEMAEAQRERLAEMPGRVWKNRRGEVVADGKIVNFYNRRAVIRGDDGRVVRVPFNDLGREEICFLTAWWELPAECILSDSRRYLDEGREEWIAATYSWTASALCHKPLYFEERALERYGHTMGPVVQPLKSGAHFFLNIAFLPYKMGMYPPNECRYALGYYRPGDCAPWMIDPVPLSLRGALLQAGAATGIGMVIP